MSWFSTLFNVASPLLQQRLVAIAANPNVQAAAMDAVKSTVDSLLQHKNDPAKQQQLGDAIKANADKIVGAVFAGTPAVDQVDAAVLPPPAGDRS